MNIQKHIYAIKEILEKEHSATQSRITNLYIEHILTIERANILGNMLKRNIRLSKNNYSTICVPLELTSLDDCTNGCFILKSKNRIPEYVGDIIIRNGNKKLTMLSPYSFTYRKKSISKAEFISWYVQDGYLYINGTVGLETVSITSIFLNNKDINDPDYVDCNCTTCVDDYDFVIDSTYIDMLYGLVIARILSLHSNGNKADQ